MDSTTPNAYRVQLTSDMQHGQATARFFWFDGKSCVQFDEEFTVFDAFNSCPEAQRGTKGLACWMADAQRWEFSMPAGPLPPPTPLIDLAKEQSKFD